MAKILISGQLETHPAALRIPERERNAALELWIRTAGWLAYQRAHGAVRPSSTYIPAFVVRALAGPDGHELAWALCRAEMWQEVPDFPAEPAPSNLPALPAANDPRTWIRAVGYYMAHSRTAPSQVEWHIQLRAGNRSIPAVVRTVVYARDGHRCVYCGASEALTLDHIHPQARGGGDHPENLQTLCRSCNSRKGAKV